jgi:glucosylceramidase
METLSLLLLVSSWAAAAAPDSRPFFDKPRSASVFTTALGTELRLSPDGTSDFKDFKQPLETQPCVFVDPGKAFQSLIGIGGALTDASAETFAALPQDKQQEFLQAVFDPDKGIGYSLARTHIHSCDFSSATYTYVDEGDKRLESFSVAHDRAFRIPFIRRALAAAGGRLTIFASPWSPPAWMKDNGDMLHGGKLKPEFYAAWALYYAKFIRAYEGEGIPIWGLTVQNEPMAVQKWESCVFTAEDERDFLKNHLGPTLAKQGLGSKKILVWDHNRDLIYQRASVILEDPEAAKYAWGIAYHWYEDWTGGEQQFDNVRRVAEAFPRKPLFFSEGCNGPFDKARLDDWSLGERYGRTMIRDLNNGSVAWTDWNVLLDERGGPNHVRNFCFAPVHADARAGSLAYTSAYYYIGHFSKFLRPGARRVVSSSSRDALLTTAFRNEDGSLAVVVMNPSDKPVEYRLWIQGRGAPLKSRPRSISTILAR